MATIKRTPTKADLVRWVTIRSQTRKGLQHAIRMSAIDKGIARVIDDCLTAEIESIRKQIGIVSTRSPFA
jgi:hypothetical protein